MSQETSKRWQSIVRTGGNQRINMTISTTNFPTWFFTGFYGGLVCCVLAILLSLRALYTDTRQRALMFRPVTVVAVCILSLLCLLPTFIWFRMRTYTPVSLTEIAALV